MKTTTEPEIDPCVANGLASLTKQGVTVSYDLLTGERRVSGQTEGRSALMQVLAERLAASLVDAHRLTEEIRRCLNRN